MRILWLLGIVLAASAAGDDTIRNHTNKEVQPTNITTPGLDFNSAAAPSPPPARPPPPPARPPPPQPERPPPPPPASDDLWTKSRNKGCTFVEAMQTNDEDAGAAYNPPRNSAGSPYRSVNELQHWFWAPYPRDKINPDMHDFYNTWGIGHALEALSVNPFSFEYEGGKNELFAMDHRSFDPAFPDIDQQTYQYGNQIYRATGASYTFSLNWEDGVIMGLNRVSPRYAAKDREPPVPSAQLPQLNQFSDVAWIGWDVVSKREGTDVKKLRYFVSVSITNPDTQAVILRALSAKGWQLSPWPGHIFEMQSTEAPALLGTPNLQGFAYFLIQHKNPLGNMYIDKLQVFYGDTLHQYPCVVLHVSQPRTPGIEPEKREAGRGVTRTHMLRAKL